MLRRPVLLGLFRHSTAVSAETTVVDPGLNARYDDADPDHWTEIFERPGRELFDRRFQVVQALGIEPGKRIADVGANSGLYTMLFARAVGPEGLVYAVDISESFVAAIESRAARLQLQNVVPVVSDQHGTVLPSNRVDLVFVAHSCYHFEYPRSMLASIRQALVTGGE